MSGAAIAALMVHEIVKEAERSLWFIIDAVADVTQPANLNRIPAE